VTLTQKPIEILLIDDHEVVRQGLKMLIESHPNFRVTGEVNNGAAALEFLAHNDIDIILFDLDLGPEDGLDLLPKLWPVAGSAKVLVLTGVRDEEKHRRAMMLGAMGIVQKERASVHLMKAIEKVFAGEMWYDRTKLGSVFTDILRSSKHKDLSSDEAKIELLTEREREVIGLIALGMKNKTMGEKLFISETTVRHHLTSVFAKLGISSRLELIIYAFQHGLAKMPPQQSKSDRS
jgi:DNA-binding NarL/FixJ family response regulator